MGGAEGYHWFNGILKISLCHHPLFKDLKGASEWQVYAEVPDARGQLLGGQSREQAAKKTDTLDNTFSILYNQGTCQAMDAKLWHLDAKKSWQMLSTLLFCNYIGVSCCAMCSVVCVFYSSVVWVCWFYYTEYCVFSFNLILAISNEMYIVNNKQWRGEAERLSSSQWFQRCCTENCLLL